jgi:hypothetical protein
MIQYALGEYTVPSQEDDEEIPKFLSTQYTNLASLLPRDFNRSRPESYDLETAMETMKLCTGEILWFYKQRGSKRQVQQTMTTSYHIISHYK